MENTAKGQQSRLLSDLQREYSQRLNLGLLNCFGRSGSEEAESVGECAGVNADGSDGEQYVSVVRMATNHSSNSLSKCNHAVKIDLTD